MNDSRQRTGQGGWLITLALFCAVFIGYFTHLSYERWELYLPGLFDHPNIDSAVYNTSQGRLMFTKVLNGMFWTIHFSPVLLLASAYYLFGDSYLFMFFWQSFSIGATAIPIYLIAREILKNERTAMVLGICYLANGGIQIAAVTDYHMISHEGVFVLSAFYALLRKRWGWYLLFCALTLSVKEDASAHLIWLGFCAAVLKREYKWALITWAMGGIYALIVFKVAFPLLLETYKPSWVGNLSYVPDVDDHHFLNPPKAYLFSRYYAWLGDGGAEIARNVMTDPMGIINHLMESQVRIEAWKNLAVTMAFLPFISFTGLAVIFMPTIEIMLAEPSRIHGLFFQYPLKVIPAWTAATILGLYNFQWFVGKLGGALDKPGLGAKAAKGLRYFALTLIALYGAAAVWYFIAGPVNMKVAGVKIRIDDEFNNIVIIAAAAIIYMIASGGAAGRLAQIFGRTPAARTATAAALYILVMSLYMTKGYGAMPWSPPWRDQFKYGTADVRGHAKAIDEVLSHIPEKASVAVTPAIFNHYSHHPDADVYIGIDAYYPVNERKPEYVALEHKTYNQMQRRIYQGWIDLAVEKMFRNRDYGLLAASDEVYLFKRGFPPKNSYRGYIEHMRTSRAYQAHHHAGNVVIDKTAKWGKALKAEKDDKGVMVFGQYIDLHPGEYKAVFRLKTGQAADGPLFKIDIAAGYGKTVLAEKSMTGLEFGGEGIWKNIELPFTVPADGAEKVEFRVVNEGGASLSVDWVRAQTSPETFFSHLKYYGAR